MDTGGGLGFEPCVSGLRCGVCSAGLLEVFQSRRVGAVCLCLPYILSLS